MTEAENFKQSLEKALKRASARAQPWAFDRINGKEMAVAMHQFFGNTGSIWIETHTEIDEDSGELANKSVSGALWQDAFGTYWCADGAVDQLSSPDEWWNPEDGYIHQFDWAKGSIDALGELDAVLIEKFKINLHAFLNASDETQETVLPESDDSQDSPFENIPF